MVGQGVLRECLADPDVGKVLSIVRSPTGQKHGKLRELVQREFYDFSPVEIELSGFDTCFFCLGVTSAGMTEKAYSHVTYDLDPAGARTLTRPDVLLVEGLALGLDRPPAPGLIDCLIYLDADEADLEAWFVARFMDFWEAAANDPASFYARFRALDRAGAEGVARAVWRHMSAGHRVFLDARNVGGLDMARRFPTITALCREAGIDPVTQAIPIRPAAHYHMGGIAVDQRGRTSVDGLWACGEVACTGLHGANRLASNSLLEAAVCGGWMAQDIAASAAVGRHQPRLPDGSALRSDPASVRPILSRAAGVLRDADGLRAAARALYPLAISQSAASDPAIAGLMIVMSALRRRESRRAHARTDFPAHANPARRSTLRLDDALEAARDFVPDLVI